MHFVDPIFFALNLKQVLHKQCSQLSYLLYISWKGIRIQQLPGFCNWIINKPVGKNILLMLIQYTYKDSLGLV